MTSGTEHASTAFHEEGPGVCVMDAITPQAATKNRLLSSLSLDDYELLHPHLEEVELAYRQVLYAPYKPISFVYFFQTGVGSLVNTMKNGAASEVGTIGNEGIAGLPILLGDDRAPTNVYVQVPGRGLRIETSVFQGALDKSLDANTLPALCARVLQPSRAICRL